MFYSMLKKWSSTVAKRQRKINSFEEWLENAEQLVKTDGDASLLNKVKNSTYNFIVSSMGQFLCKVELPLDDEMGRPIIAEILHRGKKKEAVVQCALEACRILDRFGVLRQATHESRKRRARNWEENDYYDSDDDTFLDRTGTVEKKREKRMKVKEPEKVETYESLVAKEKEISASIAEIEKKLSLAHEKLSASNSRASGEEDSLDSYMKELGEDKPDRQTVSKLRLELSNLRKSHANVIRLANIAKPANLPPLVASCSSASTSGNKAKSALPIFGKRRAVPVKFPVKPTDYVTKPESVQTPADMVEEEDSEDDAIDASDKNEREVSTNEKENQKLCSESSNNSERYVDGDENPIAGTSNDTFQLQTNEAGHSSMQGSQDNNDNGPQEEISDSDSSEEDRLQIDLDEFRPIKTFHDTETFKKFEKIMKGGLPAVADRHKQKLIKILRKLQRLASNEDRMHTDWKMLSAKKRKVMKWISELRQSETAEINEKLEFMVSTELNRILNELNAMTEDKFKVIGQVKQMGHDLKTISMEIDRDIQDLKNGINTTCTTENAKKMSDSNGSEGNTLTTETDVIQPKPGFSKKPTAEELEEKKKKNHKRDERRQHRAELERQRGYEEDASREDYNMWVPPSDQSGDGRTSLNDKFGY